MKYLTLLYIIITINCFAQSKDTSFAEYHYPEKDSIEIMDFPLDEDDDIKEVIEEEEETGFFIVEDMTEFPGGPQK